MALIVTVIVIVYESVATINLHSIGVDTHIESFDLKNHIYQMYKTQKREN